MSLAFSFGSPDSKSRTCFWSLFLVSSLVSGVYLISFAFDGRDYTQKNSTWEIFKTIHGSTDNVCKNHCKPQGSESLPEKIVVATSNFKMLTLGDSSSYLNKRSHPVNLLAMAVGFKQKETVNQIVKKFFSSDFVVMLFHYDGIVDQWREFPWNDEIIHISAAYQTKWWFAKRFLHPDISADYNYIFLWDEDIGVENFNPIQYLSVVKREGLEISQPALDPAKSVIHHPITARRKNSIVHRRIYKFKGSSRCYGNSTAPPCVGWVEMMVPVFSKMAWRCAWYMLQNDLIHAWGMDKQLGYCAQGDRLKNVGVVDSEYVVHLGLPTLGSLSDKNVSTESNGSNTLALEQEKQAINESRLQVRKQSSNEMQIFWQRWKSAERADKCWVDPFSQKKNGTTNPI